MQLIYTHENPALVGLAASLLENAGIPATLKNQYTSAGMAPPYNINQELWILQDGDYDRAMEVLETMTEPEKSSD